MRQKKKAKAKWSFFPKWVNIFSILRRYKKKKIPSNEVEYLRSLVRTFFFLFNSKVFSVARITNTGNIYSPPTLPYSFLTTLYHQIYTFLPIVFLSILLFFCINRWFMEVRVKKKEKKERNKRKMNVYVFLVIKEILFSWTRQGCRWRDLE